MCPPGLHITLGIFLRLFVLLENACHELDLTAHMQGTEDCGPSYRRFAAALEQLTKLKDEQLALKSTKQQLEQLLTHGLAIGVFTTSTLLLQQALKDLQATKTRLQQLVGILLNLLVLLSAQCTHSQHTEIAQLDETLNKGFYKEEGPFVNSLEQALASFHVQRQAYYSGTFVGNHVHRALKVKIVNLLDCTKTISVCL